MDHLFTDTWVDSLCSLPYPWIIQSVFVSLIFHAIDFLLIPDHCNLSIHIFESLKLIKNWNVIQSLKRKKSCHPLQDINLKDIKLSEISQSQNQKSCKNPLKWFLKLSNSEKQE